jgi:hypothetical protein
MSGISAWWGIWLLDKDVIQSEDRVSGCLGIGMKGRERLA